MTKIAIITYATPHQKTQDVLSKLLLKGYTDIHLFALPFTPRKVRPVKYLHRFNSPTNIHPRETAQSCGFPYTPVNSNDLCSLFERSTFDAILIAGAGLLPEELALNHKVINAHPGFLPKVKGLDSLKWALYHNIEELGVTTHFISEKADEGILIEQKIVPIYKEDSFHSFALRQYQTEIEMLVEAVEKITKPLPTKSLINDSYKATMRMPLKYEEQMLANFNERRSKAPSIWEKE